MNKTPKKTQTSSLNSCESAQIPKREQKKLSEEKVKKALKAAFKQYPRTIKGLANR